MTGTSESVRRSWEKRRANLAAKHGGSPPVNPEVAAAYRSWSSARDRCGNPNAANWSHYGGRGIGVCDRWSRFTNFLADMGPRPEGTTLDRIDNDGNYEPGNCRWATRAEQGNNQSNNVRYVWCGLELHLSDWSRKLQINRNTLNSRLRKGWPLERVLTHGVNAEILAAIQDDPKPSAA